MSLQPLSLNLKQVIGIIHFSFHLKPASAALLGHRIQLSPYSSIFDQAQKFIVSLYTITFLSQLQLLLCCTSAMADRGV
jgi:hypothetical protein